MCSDTAGPKPKEQERSGCKFGGWQTRLANCFFPIITSLKGTAVLVIKNTHGEVQRNWLNPGSFGKLAARECALAHRHICFLAHW